MHLLHPVFVHFSVAFLTFGGTCEVCGLLLRRERLARWGGQLLLVGLASLVPTIVTGYLAANASDPTAAGRGVLDAHERNGWILLGLLLATQFGKAWYGDPLPPGWDKLYAALVAVTALLTLYSAWLGGQLVYAHGIGVR